MVVQKPEPNARDDRSLQYGVVPIDTLSCHISAIDGQFEDGTDEQVYSCTIYDGQSKLGGGMMYSIDLSDDFVNEHRDCIMNGHCYVDIEGGMTNEDGDVPTIEIPEAAGISVIDKSEIDPDPTARRKLRVTGTHPVLVVRVQGKDSSCNPSSSDLAGSIFGLGNKKLANSMKAQYDLCSQGLLSMDPVAGNNVNDGVVDVYINKKIDGTNIFSLTNAMFQAADAAVGTSLNTSPRHIMYVVPPGTTFRGSTGWVAFAHVSGYNSWYNDEWGDRLSAQVHEVGWVIIVAVVFFFRSNFTLTFPFPLLTVIIADFITLTKIAELVSILVLLSLFDSIFNQIL